MLTYSDILLTVDFDRTLTAPDSSIPQRNLDAIRDFMALGGSFTVNTGRSVPMFLRHMRTVPVNAPFLLYNGSGAYDLAEGAVSLQKPIDLDLWDTLDKVHAFCPEMNLEIQAIDAHYSYGENPEWNSFYEAIGVAHAAARRGMELGPFLKFSVFGEIREYTVSHLFSGSQVELRRMDEIEQWLRQSFGEKTEVFRAGPRIIDVHAKGASKSNAARALQQRLGKKILVCVGDAENDLSMLYEADYAFCPADGVVADRFENVCKCADGAVADVIYEKIPEILAKHP